MTKEEMLEQLKHDRDLCNFNPSTGESEPIDEDCRKSAKALDMAIKALEQQPCEDTISRQAVDDAIYDYSRACDVDYAQIMEYIDKLPSAQPERKKGQWMKEDRGHVEYCAVCDQCGFDWIWSDREYFKFCPNCGADMRGEQDEY